MTAERGFIPNLAVGNCDEAFAELRVYF